LITRIIFGDKLKLWGSSLWSFSTPHSAPHYALCSRPLLPLPSGSYLLLSFSSFLNETEQILHQRKRINNLHVLNDTQCTKLSHLQAHELFRYFHILQSRG
jgi:hypothetical protein